MISTSLAADTPRPVLLVKYAGDQFGRTAIGGSAYFCVDVVPAASIIFGSTKLHTLHTEGNLSDNAKFTMLVVNRKSSEPKIPNCLGSLHQGSLL